MIRAPAKATPAMPRRLFAVAAAMLAIHVPWPCGSVTAFEPNAEKPPVRRPAKSGFVPSTPVSTTAIVTWRFGLTARNAERHPILSSAHCEEKAGSETVALIWRTSSGAASTIVRSSLRRWRSDSALAGAIETTWSPSAGTRPVSTAPRRRSKRCCSELDTPRRKRTVTEARAGPRADWRREVDCGQAGSGATAPGWRSALTRSASTVAETEAATIAIADMQTRSVLLEPTRSVCRTSMFESTFASAVGSAASYRRNRVTPHHPSVWPAGARVRSKSARRCRSSRFRHPVHPLLNLKLSL